MTPIVGGCVSPSLPPSVERLKMILLSGTQTNNNRLRIHIDPPSLTRILTHSGRRRPDGEQRPSSLHGDQVHDGLPLRLRDGFGALLLLRTYTFYFYFLFLNPLPLYLWLE